MNKPPNILEFNEGWGYLQEMIKRQTNILEGLPEPQFTVDDYSKIYITIYDLCRPTPFLGYARQLYDKCRESVEEYFTSMVLPSLMGKREEVLLRELVKRWTNHKILVEWYSKRFQYLDRYYTERGSVPTVKEMILTSFRNLIYSSGMHKNLRDAALALIDKERNQQQIDRVLLKNAVNFFVEIGMERTMEYYENDFEAAMLDSTADYYSSQAVDWIIDNSFSEYVMKIRECLKQEKDRATSYLHPSSMAKLLKVVERELLSARK